VLTIYTTTWGRPDLVQLLASALAVTAPQGYRLVVVVQPGGLRRQWQNVHEIVEGQVVGVQAWAEAVRRAGVDSTNLYLHDDCIPMRPFVLPPLPAARVVGYVGIGSTFIAWPGLFKPFIPRIQAPRATAKTMPQWWPEDVRQLAEQGQCEVLLGGEFLHLDKSTMHHPTLSPYNAAKRPLVEAICRHLGIDCPEPLSADELAFQTGWRPTRPDAAEVVKLRDYGLGDMVKAGLSAIGITEERVSKAIGRPCGCGKRAEKLNALGRRIGIG